MSWLHNPDSGPLLRVCGYSAVALDNAAALE